MCRGDVWVAIARRTFEEGLRCELRSGFSVSAESAVGASSRVSCPGEAFPRSGVPTEVRGGCAGASAGCAVVWLDGGSDRCPGALPGRGVLVPVSVPTLRPWGGSPWTCSSVSPLLRAGPACAILIFAVALAASTHSDSCGGDLSRWD